MTFQDIVNYINQLLQNVINIFQQLGQIWTSITNALNQAKNYALYWVQYYYGVAIGFINSQVQYYYNLAVSAIAIIRNTVNGIVSQVQGYINYITSVLMPSLISQVKGLINNLSSTIITAENTLNAIVNALRNSLIIALGSFAGNFAAFGSFITSIRNVFTPVNQANFLTLVNKYLGAIMDFFNNPDKYFIELGSKWLLNLLQWLIAYAFGTVELTLPAWPFSGGSQGYGGSINLGPLPDFSDNICPPCNPIYVSGYYFGPDHPGVDLGIHYDQDVFAAHDGIVESVQYTEVGYGHYITIRGNKLWTRYAHLHEALVRENDPVKCGQLIAHGDSTGNSTGSHLHFEVKINGDYIDPLRVL